VEVPICERLEAKTASTMARTARVRASAARGSEGREKLGVSRMCMASPISQIGLEEVRKLGLVRRMKEVVKVARVCVRIRVWEGMSGIVMSPGGWVGGLVKQGKADKSPKVAIYLKRCSLTSLVNCDSKFY
jgi:hypothetical protein